MALTAKPAQGQLSHQLAAVVLTRSAWQDGVLFLFRHVLQECRPPVLA